jgi:hypothetical protein
MEIIISETGYGNGWGSDRWKSVSGLTKPERQAVREGTAIVLISDCPPSGGGNGTGTTYRRVVVSGKGFTHRVPDDDILNRLTDAVLGGCGNQPQPTDAVLGAIN